MIGLEAIKNMVRQQGGVVKTADFIKLGLYNSDVIRLMRNHVLEKVRHGYYTLFDANEPNEASIIARLFPDAILNMDSALFHYGYSDRTPLAWTLALNRTVSTSRLHLEYPPIKPYLIDKKYLDIGVQEVQIQGAAMRIYDRERVICDCFKYRNKIDSEMFSKAIQAYISDEKKNLRHLSEYARQLRVYKKIQDVMGVWF